MLSEYKTFQKADLRVRKTERVLIASMSSILNECRFTKLTVERICKEAQISRAAFYSHFTDKYNLLDFWLLSFCTYRTNNSNTYEDVKGFINQFTNENKRIINNLLIDADQQTLEIIQNFLCLMLNINNVKRINGKIVQKNIVAVNLCVGGIINYLLWQVRNNFPPDVSVINEYSFDAIKMLCGWVREQ